MTNRFSQSGNPLISSVVEYSTSLPTLTDKQTAATQADINGVTLVNPGVSNGTPTQIAHTVGTTSVPVLDGTLGTKYLRFQNHNNSTGTVYLFFGSGSAVADNTCYQILPGKDLVFDSPGYVPDCDASAITNTGTANLHVIVGI